MKKSNSMFSRILIPFLSLSLAIVMIFLICYAVVFTRYSQESILKEFSSETERLSAQVSQQHSTMTFAAMSILTRNDFFNGLKKLYYNSEDPGELTVNYQTMANTMASYLNSLYQEGEQPLEQALSLPAPYYHVLMAAGMNDQNQLILRCRTLLALEKHPELQMCIYQYGFLILLGVGQADAPNRLEQSAATIAAWERDSGATALLLLTDRAVAREELKREVRHLFHAHQKNLVLGKSVVMRLSAARTPEANTKEEQALTERLQQSLTAQNAEHFHMALCQLFSSWESRSADIYTIKQLLFALVSRVSQKRENSDDPITLMNTLMDTLYRATGYEAACSAVWAVLEPELFPVSGLENESPKQSQRMFHKIVQFLNHHIDQNYSLQEISDTFGISQPYVSKLFRANAGTSYKDYVTKQKIQTAIEIMTSNPAVLIKDIAEQLGYDQLYFSTVFHRITGEYPKHYREQLERRAKDGQA